MMALDGRRVMVASDREGHDRHDDHERHQQHEVETLQRCERWAMNSASSARYRQIQIMKFLPEKKQRRGRRIDPGAARVPPSLLYEISRTPGA